MTKTSIHLGDIHIGTSLQNNADRSQTAKDPFHILVLGDFSGSHAPNSHKVINLDRDNFEEVFARLNPQIEISLLEDSSNHVTLSFSELEDFEPDAIYEKLEIFSQLRSLRRRLSNNSSFAEAAKEMSSWGAAHTEESNAAPAVTENTPIGANVLDVLLAETEKRTTSENTVSGSDLARNLIREIVAPHVIPAADPKQPEMIRAVDESISEQMSSLLHNPDFQQMEAAWRSLYFLIRNVSTDTDLKIYLLDIKKESLMALMNSEEPDKTTFFKQYIEPYSYVVGAKAWSVMLGNYSFGDNHEDIQLMKYMAVYAAQCNATFVAAAECSLLGCENLATTPDPDDWQIDRDEDLLANWQKLRNMPHSRHLALTFPRFLLRLPYGKQGKPVECFDYEEMPTSVHNQYLWGNAAFAWTVLLAESFSQNQWQFKPGQLNEVSDLPAHIYHDDGEQSMKPCAEILLTERGGEKITSLGITPCWSVSNRGAIRIGPFVSLNASPQLVAGRWVS